MAIAIGAIVRMLREARRAKQPRAESDLQEAEERHRDEDALKTAHTIAPGWYVDAEDDGVRRYFDGRAFTATERWNGTAWRKEEY